MSKVWSGVGAWALDAERAEAEEREQAAAAATAPASSILAGESAQSFPSLREASSSKQSKKKKKPVAIPLSQFATGSYGTGGGRSAGFDSAGLTPEEMLRLPTGPRERSPEELEHGRHGGGFRFYGGAGGGLRGGFSSRRIDDDGGGSWGGPGGQRGYGGSDVEPRRGPPARASDFDQPSRADEVDNWGTGKKWLAPPPAFSGRVDRYSSLGSGSSSRADEMDSWSGAKKPFTSDHPSFGTGRRDSRTRPNTSLDRWVQELGGTVTDGGEKPKLILVPPKRAVGVQSEPARTRPSPFGNARPREEVLAQKKGLDWRKMDVDINNKKTSRPTSSQSSRPSSSQSSRPGSSGLPSTSPKPKVNPFGNAKPREVLLQEKGVDWRKIDSELEHRSVDRPETDEEKLLKKEINHLKAQAAEREGHFNDRPAGSSAELSELHEEIATKERDLELLIRQLDDKVKFGEKAVCSVRPGSGSSRSDSSSTRAVSQSGIAEDLRNVEIIDRPCSRGGRAGYQWTKPLDDRRSFQRSRDRSFFDSDSVVRTSSRVGW